MLSIVKRNEVYYFRQRVPVDMRKHFRCAEVVRSLHTGLYRQAKSLARGKLGELERVFMTIRSGVLTEDEIVLLIDKYKREQLSKSESFMDALQEVDGSNIKDARALLSEYWSDEVQAAKDVLLDQRGMNELVVGVAHNLLGTPHKQLLEQGEDGVNIASYSPEFKSLCRAVALANKEIYDTLIQRNETGDSEYDRQERAKPKSKTLGELIAEYHAEKAGSWADPQSTIAIHNRIIHMLGNIRLDTIDRKTCVAFRDDLKQYPLKNDDYVTPWRELAKKKKTRLSERTQLGTMTELVTLLDYANNNGMGVKGNPAKGLTWSKDDCKTVKNREIFTTEELCKMVGWLATVDKTKASAKFWIPLLLLFTGARSNEICMLRCDDVVDGFIHFRNLPEYHQRTKNGKDRKAPIHSQLVKLGFLDFCGAQRKAGCDRLFPALKEQRGKWNIDYGKQFNRTDKTKFLVDYTPEQLRAKDLHCYRKTFIHWFVNVGRKTSLEDVRTLQSIIGHIDAEELRFMREQLQLTQLTIDCYAGGMDVDQSKFMELLDYGVDFGTLLT